MFDLVALLIAVVLLMVILNLRAIMGRRYAIVGARLVHGVAPPAPMADLYAQAHEVLAAAGFEGPTWVMSQTRPAEANLAPLRAVYRHRESHAAAWLMPALNIGMPNVLLTYWTTELADGRVLTSQALDRYAELVGGEHYPAQTIYSTDLLEQWRLHREWCASFGVAAREDGLDDAAIERIGGAWHNERLEALAQRGDLVPDAEGGWRATWRYGLRTYFAMTFGRKPTAKTAVTVTAVPISRLVFLAGVVERVRRYVPTRAVQWTLFLASLALFLALGAIAWEPRFAAILLVAVAFHEWGHYLAMRAFGYRNVHMLALPLVGGVTIGEDADPSATRRAWMSLMGPLPGIIVGWVLLILPMLTPLSETVAIWAREAALVFLFLNYLNVLPMPPLDGGHVVQAMLPARWLNLQVAFVAVACVLGAIVAWWLGFVLLAIIAGMQLLGLPSKLAVGRATRRLLDDPRAARERARPTRLIAAFEALEREAGPAKQAQARIGQAEQVLQAIDLRPMSWLSRLVVGTVYGGLLIVPVVGAVVWFSLFSGEAIEQAEARAREMGRESAAFTARAERAEWPELLGLEGDEAARVARRFDPADDLMLDEVERRLDVKLPEDVRAVYRLGNGSEALSLTTLASWRPISDAEVEAIKTNLDDAEEVFEAKDSPRRAFDETRIRRWINVGLEDLADGGRVVMLDLASPPTFAGERVHVLNDYLLESYADLCAYARERWVEAATMRAADARWRQQREKAFAELRDADVETLIERGTTPRSTFSLFGFGATRESPASTAAIEATEQRLGARLPDVLREVYMRRNGVASWQLLPVEALAPVSSFGPEVITRAGVLQLPSTDGPGLDALHAPARLEGLKDCVVTHAMDIGADKRWPTALWCPRRDDEVVWLARAWRFPGMREFLLYNAVEQRAVTIETP